jgi:hypothetical protein
MGMRLFVSFDKAQNVDLKVGGQFDKQVNFLQKMFGQERQPEWIQNDHDNGYA